MTKEIDIFKTKTIASFGGKTLATNLQEAENAMVALTEDFRIHNHSNTQFAWKHFVIQHKGGLRNIRQITAEINRKKLALHEAKYKYAKKAVEIENLQYEIDHNKDCLGEELTNLDIKMINIKLAELEESMELILPPIEGAIKDILTLKKVYNDIMERYPDYTEADLEHEEIDYWIRRLFSQALRDMRQSGVIMAGNQEAIEQIGLNVSHVMRTLGGYLQGELKTKNSGGKLLAEFLDRCVDQYREHVQDSNGYGGFTGKIFDRSLYIPEEPDIADIG